MMENEKDLEKEVEVVDVSKESLHDSDAPGATESVETESNEEENEDSVSVDYSSYTKAQLLEVVKELVRTDDYKKIDATLKEIKPFIDEIRTQERADALEKFIKEGGNENDFEYRLDESDHSIDATLKLLRDRRNQFFKNLEENKSENLRKKNEVLEKLRALVDGEDSAHSFDTFKQLQVEWKQIGPVPSANLKTLWANYNALVDRFYDHRNIYFELKELDRKKNLEAKLELCVKAEKLDELSSIKDAVRELNVLHDEFKHVGPVPKEEQENVWQRFKKASDAIYAKRDAFVEQLQKDLSKNFELKLQLVEVISSYADFISDRIKEWNQKTNEVLDVQKKWDAIGAVPRSKAKEINKKFWSAFKSFFHNKGQFFKKLDEERDKNLKAKQELVARANELKGSEDWQKTSHELIELQKRWKEIGPVPEKQRDRIYKEFKEACDFFFEQRRGVQDKADQDQENNLKIKEAVVAELERITKDGSATLEKLDELQQQFGEAGFVPKRAIASIKQSMENATNQFIDSIGELSNEEKESKKLEAQLVGLKNDPQGERKIVHKEQHLRKQISKAENDLAVLRNNLEFFGRSKNANKLKEEFNEKIKMASDHLGQLKKQLKLLQSA